MIFPKYRAIGLSWVWLMVLVNAMGQNQRVIIPSHAFWIVE